MVVRMPDGLPQSPSSDEFVAKAAIPISCLRQGLRSVKLTDSTNTRSGPFDFASLLIEVEKTRGLESAKKVPRPDEEIMSFPDYRMSSSRLSCGKRKPLVLGLVWLKSLGFMQNLNPQLASFVICFFEMIRDIGQMLFVLLVVVLGFGDMFHTTYIPYRGNPMVCPNFNETSEEILAAKVENRLESPFCTGKRRQSYLGVYRMIVGDINYNDFNANTFTSILFVLVTFITIIFLLNMLIAIIVESYEKSQKRSKGLFGRTRVASHGRCFSWKKLSCPKTFEVI